MSGENSCEAGKLAVGHNHGDILGPFHTLVNPRR